MGLTPVDRRQDRAIEREIDDALDRGTFLENLTKALIREERAADGTLLSRSSTGFVVGLTGRWGLGKSSVLNLIQSKLSSMDNVVVVKLNPWLFKGRDELVTAYFASLREALGRSQSEQVRDLVSDVDKYWDAIEFTANGAAAVVSAATANPLISWATSKFLKGTRTVVKKPETLTPDEERKSLERKLAEKKVAVVVLIDELDRVEDEDVRAVAQLIKAVGDIKGMSYLVAYDPKRVSEALGRSDDEDVRRETGQAYLEKIIQFAIPLRPLFDSDVDDLIAAGLADHGINLPSAETASQKEILSHLRTAIKSPRDVKRLLGAYAVLENILRGEICPYDVLAYAWLTTKAPALRDRIADDLDKVVDDPSEEEMVARLSAKMDDERSGSRRSTPSAVAILDKPAIGHERLLATLFPRFADGSRSSRASDGQNGDRLSLRRNLVRALYLGNPPGMLARQEIERIWATETVPGMTEVLSGLRNSGTMPALLDRLDDLLPQLPSSNDHVFWVALARLLVRQTDWISHAEPERAFTDDAATVLMRLGIRDRSNVPRVKAVVEALIADGDLLIAPLILRKHMFAHGLTRHRPGGTDREVIYDAAETAALLDRELPRYRAAVIDGTALKRLTNVEAVFVIANRDLWDSDLKDSLTGQLDSFEALSTIAGMIVPPGYSIDRSALAELFDIDIVKPRLESAIQQHPAGSNSWLLESMRRMGRVLAGRDPSFLDDDDEEPEIHIAADESAGASEQ